MINATRACRYTFTVGDELSLLNEMPANPGHVNKKYFPDRSLDKIETSLPEEHFFRLNRQYILNRQVLTGFKRTGNGKIEVLVNGPENLPSSIAVSRKKAVSFKNWFEID